MQAEPVIDLEAKKSNAEPFVKRIELKSDPSIPSSIPSMDEISVCRTTRPQTRPSPNSLGFGKYFTDHMFLADYNAQLGWNSSRVVPYGPLTLDPASQVLHYGQAMFEGLKAFRTSQGKVLLFRPDFHCQRIAEGAKRLCIPSPPPQLLLNAIKKLISVDQDWVPSNRGCSLYIRPTLLGVEKGLGVQPSQSYLLFIILSPVGSYYAEGMNPVKIWVEDELVRACPGGLGSIKAAANYAGSLYASTRAKQNGYTQVLWLDAVERRYLEEVGTMNVFFRIKDEIITPPLSGTILGGATRNSVLHLLKDWNQKVSERPLSIDELLAAQEQGTLQEVFGTGTAAVISPVGELAYKGRSVVINQGRPGPLSQKLYDHVTAIQYGEIPDPYSWMMPLDSI